MYKSFLKKFNAKCNDGSGGKLRNKINDRTFIWLLRISQFYFFMF